MANLKSDEQKLEELKKKIEQLKARKKALEARTKQKERSERTRRLIQIGALSEKYLNCVNIEPIDYEKILKKLVQIEQVKTEIKMDENG